MILISYLSGFFLLATQLLLSIPATATEQEQAIKSEQIIKQIKDFDTKPAGLEKAKSIHVGDYVEYSPNKENYKEYGTVIKDLCDGWFIIRPHRTQGDFKASFAHFNVVDPWQEIETAVPKYDKYTINLMWVKDKKDHGPYIFRTKEVEENLAKATAWARKNPKTRVVIWYDSATVDEDAVINTYEVLNRIFSQYAQQIAFEDLRQFSEVRNNPSIFSGNIPIYFRVDLLRIICAYHLLKDAKRETYFVYADLDVSPMDRHELFDSSTLIDLFRYGTVMARGAVDFENSLQIWSNNQPNLLWAAKTILIDTSIFMAKNISVEPQTIFYLYRDMFRLFYGLQNWLSLKPKDLKNLASIKDAQEKNSNLTDDQINQIFFDDSYNYFYGFPLLNYKINNKDLIFHKEYFLDGLEKIDDKALYFPTKIINAPPTRFGGAPPTKSDPEQISPRNYPWKLYNMLKSRSFDSRLLSIAEKNNYLSVISLITDY
jgi:hypothetical protein